MVLALTIGIRQTNAPTITAINDAGIFLRIFGDIISIASPSIPTPNAQILKVEMFSKTSISFSVVSIAVVPAG